MPVGPAGYAAVVGDPRPQASGAEGAADIRIETRIELQDAKLADFKLACLASGEDQGVCAGPWVHNAHIKRWLVIQAL